jgi:hypothetical protein
MPSALPCDLNLYFGLEPYSHWSKMFEDIGGMDGLNLRLFIHSIKSVLAEYGNQIALVDFEFCQPDAL